MRHDYKFILQKHSTNNYERATTTSFANKNLLLTKFPSKVRVGSECGN